MKVSYALPLCALSLVSSTRVAEASAASTVNCNLLDDFEGHRYQLRCQHGGNQKIDDAKVDEINGFVTDLLTHVMGRQAFDSKIDVVATREPRVLSFEFSAATLGDFIILTKVLVRNSMSSKGLRRGELTERLRKIFGVDTVLLQANVLLEAGTGNIKFLDVTGGGKGVRECEDVPFDVGYTGSWKHKEFRDADGLIFCRFYLDNEGDRNDLARKYNEWTGVPDDDDCTCDKDAETGNDKDGNLRKNLRQRMRVWFFAAWGRLMRMIGFGCGKKTTETVDKNKTTVMEASEVKATALASVSAE